MPNVSSFVKGLASRQFHPRFMLNNLTSSTFNPGSFGQEDLEWAIGLNRRVLGVVGLWPGAHRNIYWNSLAEFRTRLTFTMVTCVLTLPTIYSFMQVWGDLLLMSDNLQILLPLTACVLKTGILWRKKEDVAPLVRMLVADWMRVKSKKEHETMMRRAGLSRAITIGGCSIMICGFVLIVSIPLLGLSIQIKPNATEVSRQLPIPTQYVYEVTQSPAFEMVFLAQSLSLLLSACVYTGTDNFLGLLILHICGQLEILRLRIGGLNRHQDFGRAVKKNVLDHLRLIRAVFVIEDTFHLMLLSLLFNFGITFCLQGFLVVDALNQSGDLSIFRLFWLLSIILNVTMHTCLYCAVGEILLTQSDQVFRATFDCEWYALPPQRAKNLIMVMFRASKPLHITAGKMFPITMSTFGSLLKTSAGYISVLLANTE